MFDIYARASKSLGIAACCIITGLPSLPAVAAAHGQDLPANGGNMERSISHPGLGTLTGYKEEWHLREPLELPFLGFSTSNVVVVASGAESEPSLQQLDAVLALARSPAFFKDAIAMEIFDAYQKEIYPRYTDPRYSFDSGEKRAPKLSTSSEVWNFVTGIYGIWVDAEGTIDLEFSVTFDEEHELHVHMTGNAVDYVSLE